MLLSQILAGVPLAEKLSGDAEISAVELDSRKTVPGALFIALNGKNSDGRKFIPDALEKGAAAVLRPHDAAGQNGEQNKVRRQFDAATDFFPVGCNQADDAERGDKNAEHENGIRQMRR